MCLAAFLYCLQLIEKLYRARWTKLDGLGALVLTPTRELALQIFEELVKVGLGGNGLPGKGMSGAAQGATTSSILSWGWEPANDAQVQGKRNPQNA